MPAGTAIPFDRYFASRHRAIINDESWLQVTHNWVTKRTLGNNTGRSRTKCRLIRLPTAVVSASCLHEGVRRRVTHGGISWL